MGAQLLTAYGIFCAVTAKLSTWDSHIKYFTWSLYWQNLSIYALGDGRAITKAPGHPWKYTGNPNLKL